MSESSVLTVLEEAAPDKTAPDEVAPGQAPPEDDAVLAEFLVEEVSIDGMCGVY